MTSKPIVLDLFCGAGGAARGYQLAGFEVYGVDCVLRPTYAGDHFILGDVLTFLRSPGGRALAERASLIHRSDPCQAGSALTIGTNRASGGLDRHVQYIPMVTPLLPEGVPYVIEQPVGDAPIRGDVMLCMDMFPVMPPKVWRHRWFQLEGWKAEQPPHARHVGRVRGWPHGVRHEGDYVAVYGKGGGKATVAEAQHALGIDWTDVWEELTEAIPPAYTQWLGLQFKQMKG